MDDDFTVECSDDEIRGKQHWEPPPNEIVRLYNILDKDELPELIWKSPGYRAPSPKVKENIEEHKQIETVDTQDDFDFMDELSSPKLKIRKDGEEALRGSAKKKTTSLDGVLSNMRRHNLLPQKSSNK